jgi:hypothetical protein
MLGREGEVRPYSEIDNLDKMIEKINEYLD